MCTFEYIYILINILFLIYIYIYVYIYIYMCVCERVYIMRIESPALNVFLCHDTAAIHTCG